MSWRLLGYEVRSFEQLTATSMHDEDAVVNYESPARRTMLSKQAGSTVMPDLAD